MPQYDQDYFSGRTSFFYRLTGYRDFHGYFNRLARWFRPYVPEGPLLDIGCAYGFLLARFNDGRALSGCDVSAWAIEQAKARLPSAQFSMIRPGAGLPYTDASFSAVLCTDVLEHIEPDHQPPVLREVVRVLRPGGRFCMTSPNFGAMRRRRLYRRADRIEGHLGMRHVSEWKDLLSQHELRVVDSWTYLHGFLPGKFHRSWLPECAVIAEKV
jgi:SAM-dependent methyltransferase